MTWTSSLTKKTSALALGIVLASAIGCDPNSRPPSGRADPLPAAEYSQVQASGNLNKFLLFDRAIVIPSEGDKPLEVEVPTRCKELKYPVAVQYRFEFYDRSNRLLTRDERWVFLKMEPRLQYRLKGLGTHPDAVDWRLIVRPAV